MSEKKTMSWYKLDKLSRHWLSDTGFKAKIIKLLQQSVANSIATNETKKEIWAKKLKLCI